MQSLAGTHAGTGGTGAGGILLFSPTAWAASWGGDEGHTHTGTHTQERTRKCCTYPLATYPLKTARELLRGFWFSHCRSCETPFREWDFAFRELFSELRELLQEYPRMLPELRESPFHSESDFPEIGVVPRLLKMNWGQN